MKGLRRLAHAIDKISSVAGEASSWLVFLLVLITTTDVIMRYFFSAGSVALQELEWHLYAANFIIAAGWTMKNDQHVRIDLFYQHFGPKTKAAVNLIGAIIFCIPFCLIVIWAAWPFLMNAWEVRESSPNPGGLPARYILKAFIHLGFGLILLQSISEVVKSFLTIAGDEEYTS